MGKVPALKHGEALVTEQVAIFLYLADRFPAAGPAPRIGDPLRGPYTWITMFQLVPALPVIQAHIDRLSARPAAVRVRAKDAALAAAHG
jgi:glutathione S-transferase